MSHSILYFFLLNEGSTHLTLQNHIILLHNHQQAAGLALGDKRPLQELQSMMYVHIECRDHVLIYCNKLYTSYIDIYRYILIIPNIIYSLRPRIYNLGPDQTHPSTINLDRGHVQIHSTKIRHIQSQVAIFWDGGRQGALSL